MYRHQDMMEYGNSFSTYNTGNDINVESISAQIDMDDAPPPGPGPALFYDETRSSGTPGANPPGSNMYNSLPNPSERPLPPVPYPAPYPAPYPLPAQQGMHHPQPLMPPPGYLPSPPPGGYLPPPGAMVTAMPSGSREKLMREKKERRRRRRRKGEKRELQKGCGMGMVLVVVILSVLIVSAIIAVVVLTRVE